MSGRKGKGHNPFGYFEPNRQMRRRLARGKGMMSSVAPVLARQAVTAKRKEGGHEQR